MSTTLFGYNLRVLMCNNCGAPLQADVRGGTFACEYCGSHNQLVARDTRRIADLAPPARPISEEERLQRLRAQDGKPLVPPPSLQGLVGPGGEIPPWKVQEALAVWQSTRAELASNPSSYEAAERLLFLTMVMANHFSTNKDLLRQRAMFESALEAFTLPRHRQVMCGYLSRCAAREGDLEAAQQWLAPCDTTSDDLQTDSSYRFSRAFLDTARGDWAAVIRVLGKTQQDVPLMDAMDGVCTVLRANAWEKLGHVDYATRLLREYMTEGGAQGRQSMARIIDLYADWGLCAQSFQAATACHARAAGAQSARQVAGGAGMMLFVMGLIFIIVGAVTGVISVGVVIWGGPFAAILGPVIMALVFIPLGVGLFIFGKKMRAAAARAARIRAHGTAGTAQVLAVDGTGLRVNGVPQARVRLRVQLPDKAPYEASTKLLLHPASAAGLAPGASVPVRVDPRDPQALVIETD